MPRRPPPRPIERPSLDALLPADFLEGLRSDPSAACRTWVPQIASGIYRLPKVEPAWCADFLARYDARIGELTRLGQPPAPPNSMHDAGAALTALGWGDLFDEALREWLRPISAQLFGDLGGADLDSIYGFVVDYGMTGDEMLGYHADDAVVTVNLCLENDCDGAELYFRGMRCPDHRQSDPRPGEEFEYVHEAGIAILHAGANRHGVRWIEGGRRRNLILWLQSSKHPAAMLPPGSPCPAWCQRARSEQ